MMKWLTAMLFSTLMIFSLREKSEFPRGKIVDLSHSYDSATIYWPTEDGFRLEKEYDGMTDKGYYYASNKFCTAEHGGTHIDAPVHFAKGGRTVDQIPLEQLTGTAVIIDVQKQCEANRDYQITTEDLQAWEKKNGTITNGAIVLLRTGYGRRWPDRQSYMGTDERGAGAVAKLHFPGLHPEAARWLTLSRQIKAVGLDTPSIDYGQSTLFESHRILFEKNVPAFENLANLDQLPLKDFLLIALPMKIKGGSGGPLRVIAIVN
ncbi:MAG TPA: cyclase family protein [Pyrinomonadaceae bacterium]|jgi:kynurenine formamidase|nr:cyclase family protein [Pyrinomonadaceae bacterium]